MICDKISLELVGKLEKEVDATPGSSEFVRVSEIDEADSEAEVSDELCEILELLLLGSLEEELDVTSRFCEAEEGADDSETLELVVLVLLSLELEDAAVVADNEIEDSYNLEVGV